MKNWEEIKPKDWRDLTRAEFERRVVWLLPANLLAIVLFFALVRACQ